jgi:hypothetical protein
MCHFDKKWVGLHFGRFLSQAHLVTLILGQPPSSIGPSSGAIYSIETWMAVGAAEDLAAHFGRAHRTGDLVQDRVGGSSPLRQGQPLRLSEKFVQLRNLKPRDVIKSVELLPGLPDFS